MTFALTASIPSATLPPGWPTYRKIHELPNNWTLLRGTPDDVLELAALLGVKFKKDARGQFAHSNILTVLNAGGEVAHQQIGLNQSPDETVKQTCATPPSMNMPAISQFKRLDVRPLLKRGEEPLPAILKRVQGLAAGTGLIVTASFLPSPFIELLGSRAFSRRSSAARPEAGLFTSGGRPAKSVAGMTTTLAEFKQIGIANALRSCQLFAGMSSVELSALAEITAVKSVPKGSYLFHEGDPSSGFYVVQTGAINVHRVNGIGKEQVIHVFRAGESFAEGTLATDKGYPADARAVEESQVMLVQKSGMLALLRRQPELALRMLGSMSAHLRILVAQLEDLTLKDVETRLANWLLKRCPNPASEKSCKIELTMTKRVLASELGTVSETFSRTLAKFREQGLIEVKGRIVTVLSPAKLATLLRRNLGE